MIKSSDDQTSKRMSKISDIQGAKSLAQSGTDGSNSRFDASELDDVLDDELSGSQE